METEKRVFFDKVGWKKILKKKKKNNLWINFVNHH